MLKYISAVLMLSQGSYAFDPFTAALGAQAAQGMMDKAEETADFGFALTDLLEELGVESDSEADIEAALARLNKINSEARDIRSTNEDFNRNIEMTLNNGNSITKRLKYLRNTIKTSKKLATIMGFRPKAAEKATKIQELKLNSMILEELQSIRRAQYLSMLEEKETKMNQTLVLEKLLEDSKRKPLNNTRFPKIGGGS